MKMVIGIEAVIFYLLLIDSVVAVIMSFCCAKWFKKNYKGFWKHFPVTKGWSIYYLILMLWVGYGLMRLGVI